MNKGLAPLAVLMIVVTAPAFGGESKPKLVYKPLSQEAHALGRLRKYDSIPRREVEVTLGGATLTARVPARCGAYDAVPITYRLQGDAGANDRVAVEATAFEDAGRRADRHLHDLALPGRMQIRIDYLGSRTGLIDSGRPSRLTATSHHDQYPPYTLEPLARSGTVKQGNYLFFGFRITNTGDTILDPEGFGGWLAWPLAYSVDVNGQRTQFGQTINQFERHVDYVYPGESFEQWISFWAPGQGPEKVRTLPVGRYVISYRACYRWNTEYHWGMNMWAGKPWAALEVPIEVASEAAETPVEPVQVALEDERADRMTRYIGTLEEFMTSFCVHEKPEVAKQVDRVMYVQVAPWTRQVIIKLIGNKPDQIVTAAVDVDVSSDGLAIRPNPDNPFTVTRDGRVEPAFNVQVMPAMRANIQLGPEPEKHLRDRLAGMIDCGVNTISTTGGDWHQAQIYNRGAYVGDIHAETWKYFYDTIAPQANIPVFGWGLFPNKSNNVLGVGSLYWGQEFKVPFVKAGYTYSSRPDLDVAHPDFPKLYAGVILFNHKRWGDLWYRTADGDVLIDVEDSWGWLRDDINVRYELGTHALRRFRIWLREKYGDIATLNATWGTSFPSFTHIDPQKDQGNEGNALGTDLTRIAPVYNKVDHPFHDWTPAIDDWDAFRTELRCDIYEEILRYVRKEIPTAQINLRTEGAMIPVPVKPDENSAHMRHVRNVQRRQAFIAEILARRKVFKYHSDYTTIPYSESEWRTLLVRLREQGMRGNYLPQFCTARDMLVNDHYGRDFQANYDLPEPRKAAMMHVLQAAFPVWRIMYEEGHCPGVLWEDYKCDGFVSETQMRELKLLRERLPAVPVR